jgi:predicted site-specific integrase-resolvase
MYRIGQFAKLIGVTVNTLRNWEKKGILIPEVKTIYGDRRYSEEQLQQFLQSKPIHRVAKTTKNQNKSDTNSQQLENSETHLDTTEQDKSAMSHKSAITNKDATYQHTKTIKTDLNAKEYNKPTATNKSDDTSQVCKNTSYRSIESHFDSKVQSTARQRSENGARHTIYEFQTKPDVSQSRINIGYARVSSQKKEDDLKRQIDLLELFLVKQGEPFKIISDIGYGIDYTKPGLKELLKLISTNQVDTVYILYKDRLVRCGFELIEEVARLHGTKIEVINQTIEKIDVEELVDDIVNFISMFSYILSCQTNRKKINIHEKIIQKLSNLKEKQ